MRALILSGIVLLGATITAAQAPPSSDPKPDTITVTGCVGRIDNDERAFMLANAVVVPDQTKTATPGGTSGSGAGDVAATDAKNGYRLTGSNMSSWTGKRVQIVGTVVPASSREAAAAGTSATNTGTPKPMPELRVKSVEEIEGPCPK